MRFDRVVTFGVLGERQAVGVLRYGHVGTTSVHAAACRHCGETHYEFDHPDFKSTAQWLGGHLGTFHRVRIGGLYRDASMDTPVRRGVVAQAIEEIGHAWGVPLTIADLIIWHGERPLENPA